MDRTCVPPVTPNSFFAALAFTPTPSFPVSLSSLFVLSSDAPMMTLHLIALGCIDRRT